MRLAGAGKRDVRSQFGAIPWRLNDGKVEVLLVTSRISRRWILPKGWPMHGATPAEAAATEAYEEAGVTGEPSNAAVGFYSYRKDFEGDDLPVVVAMFPLRVKKVLKDWPEKGQRKRKWVSRKKAAALLSEPELRLMVRNFDPRRLKG
ncbi:NUDIX hydrolase [Sinisalibacter aestuarii]|uniref:NUDIX hydrolase n=1 Tax=Sinisalibacter aestuarii TaxID=2949426 RepID=A0ABQ5LVG9_9RHOB|nr:NUDIX hydrolase [Sinisalibacter aestuarii]GKY88593.1 NUDIX hydrolase [Sinisalibacter aestuarii]